jgi:hypothetical protein
MSRYRRCLEKLTEILKYFKESRERLEKISEKRPEEINLSLNEKERVEESKLVPIYGDRIHGV